MHDVVAKYQRLVRKGRITQQQAEQGMRAYGCSLTLGRDFGESCDDYFVRRPDLQAFFDDRKAVFGF